VVIQELVPEAISRKLQLYKLNVRLREYGPETINKLLDAVEKSADTARIERLWAEVKPFFRKDPSSAAKYADRRYWLLLNIQRAVQLNLHQSKGLEILDIGCGPGFFMAVTRAGGHQCSGVDVPESYMTPTERRVYSELLEALHCKSHVSPLLIERFVPLPFEGKAFDLITAFWICFNRHRQPDTWGVEEWRYFVEDACRYLKKSGRLLLELNEDADRFGAMRFYDDATLEYFRSVGTVDKQRVIITRR
jgi:SAM-dependent methyltransferase